MSESSDFWDIVGGQEDDEKNTSTEEYFFDFLREETTSVDDLKERRILDDQIVSNVPSDIQTKLDSQKNQVQEWIGDIENMDGEIPKELRKIIENPYISSSMRRGKYLNQALLDSQVYYAILAKYKKGVYPFITGGDEAHIDFFINKKPFSLSLDYGNMGPTDKILGKVLKKKDGSGNVVDYFLEEVYEIALKYLSEGKPVEFIEAVTKLGEKLTATKLNTRMTEDEFYEFIEKNGFVEVDYQEYLKACGHSYNSAYQRQIGRDLIALAKSSIKANNPQNNHPTVEEVAHFLYKHFFGSYSASSHGECEKLIAFLESAESEMCLNNNKEYVIDRIEKLKGSKITAEDFIISLIDFVYVQLRKNEVEGNASYPLKKPLVVDGQERSNFVPREIQLLDVQAAITNIHPENYLDFKGLDEYLEPFIGRAKQDRKSNITWVIPPKPDAANVVTKRVVPMGIPENIGQQIIDFAQELELLDQQILNGDDALKVRRSEVLSQLNAIRYKNMNTKGDVKSKAFLENVSLENYPIDLTEYQLVTIDIENSGALNTVGHAFLDRIISHVDQHLVQDCKLTCVDSRDAGGQIQYVGQALSSTEWEKIIETLNTFSVLEQEQIGVRKNGIKLDNITRKSNKIYRLDENGKAEKPSKKLAGTFSYKIHGTIKRYQEDGKTLTGDMKKKFYELVAA